jgi:hypothetical protein
MMTKEIQEYPVDTSFIFLTDGQDTIEHNQMAFATFQLIARGCKRDVKIHVIGFGNVNDSFLNHVKTLGSSHGNFLYATGNGELQENIVDMFNIASTPMKEIELCNIQQQEISQKGLKMKAPCMNNEIFFITNIIPKSDQSNATDQESPNDAFYVKIHDKNHTTVIRCKLQKAATGKPTGKGHLYLQSEV